MSNVQTLRLCKNTLVVLLITNLHRLIFEITHVAEKYLSCHRSVEKFPCLSDYTQIRLDEKLLVTFHHEFIKQ